MRKTSGEEKEGAGREKANKTAKQNTTAKRAHFSEGAVVSQKEDGGNNSEDGVRVFMPDREYE